MFRVFRVRPVDDLLNAFTQVAPWCVGNVFNQLFVASSYFIHGYCVRLCENVCALQYSRAETTWSVGRVTDRRGEGEKEVRRCLKRGKNE